MMEEFLASEDYDFILKQGIVQYLKDNGYDYKYLEPSQTCPRPPKNNKPPKMISKTEYYDLRTFKKLIKEKYPKVKITVEKKKDNSGDKHINIQGGDLNDDKNIYSIGLLNNDTYGKWRTTNYYTKELVGEEVFKDNDITIEKQVPKKQRRVGFQHLDPYGDDYKEQLDEEVSNSIIYKEFGGYCFII